MQRNPQPALFLSERFLGFELAAASCVVELLRPAVTACLSYHSYPDYDVQSIMVALGLWAHNFVSFPPLCAPSALPIPSHPSPISSYYLLPYLLQEDAALASIKAAGPDAVL